MFKGSIPALVTPFTAAGAVDAEAFAAHVEWQISEGSHGLVPVGTTGESPTLSHAEHKRVVELCIETAAKRVPVIAGAGSNNTTRGDRTCPARRKGRRRCRARRHALLQQADAEGAVRALRGDRRERQAADRHLQYSRPLGGRHERRDDGRACTRRYPSIIGVKDATGKIERVSEQRMACGTDFVQLSGEDATALGFNAHGGVGCISVTANVAPRLCAEFQEATLAGDYAKALEYQDRLMPLHKAIFMEPGLCGAKYALNRLRQMSRTVRSPLMSTLEPATEAAIDAALRHAGLMN